MAKVLVVAPYVPHPARHGGAIRSRVLLDALRPEHDVHVGVPAGDVGERDAAAALGRDLGATVHQLPHSGGGPATPLVKVAHWLRGRSELFARRWHASARGVVAALAARERFDLVVADSSYALPVLPMRPAPAPPGLLFLHNLEAAVFERKERQGRGLGERVTRACEARAMRREERRALAHAALAVTVSEHDRALALALAPAANVVTVPNSVDLDALPLLPPAPLAPNAAPRLLFVGRLDYPPNLEAVHDLVERHLPALRAAFPGLVVRLVGGDDGGHGRQFRGIDGVEVIGPAADLLPHYRQSHAAYLPIHSGGGTRIKILEAWALGLPVLATAVGAEGLPAEDGVHLVRFETPDEGAAGLRRVLGGAAATLRANGRTLVERQFSHAAAIARLGALVGALLGERLGERPGGR